MGYLPRASVLFALAILIFASYALVYQQTSPWQLGQMGMMPGQGLPPLALMYECEGCPPPDSLITMAFLGYDAEKHAAYVTIAAESGDKRFPVSDATVFVDVFYREGDSGRCRIKTDALGEGNFTFTEDPYSKCIEEGCTIRFTFCCADIETGACLLPICLGDDTIKEYSQVEVCPGHSDYDWPLMAKTMVEETPEEFPLYPSIAEFNVPATPPNIFATFSFGFCLPVLAIFGLLSAAMFAAGRNPLAMFSFYTPQFKRGTEKMMRGRGMTWNISGIASMITSTARQSAGDAKGAIDAGKKTGSGTAAFKEGTSMGRKFTRGEGRGMGAFTHLTGLATGTALKTGGKGQQRVTAKGEVIGGGTTGHTDKMGGTFRGLASTTDSGWAKAGWVVGGTMTILGVGMLARLSRGLGPIDILVVGVGWSGGLLGLMAGAIESKGAGRVNQFWNNRKEEINIVTKMENGKPVLYFTGENGKRNRLEFENSEEGMAKLTAKVSNLMMEIETGIAASATMCRAAAKAETLSSASSITSEQLEKARKDARGSEFFTAADKNGDGKLSRSEFESALKKATSLEEMSTLILAHGGKGGLPSASVLGGESYTNYILNKVQAGTLTAEEFKGAALVLAQTTSDARDLSSTAILAGTLAQFQESQLGSGTSAQSSIGDNATNAMYLAIGAAACAAASADLQLKELPSMQESQQLADASIRALGLLQEAGAYLQLKELPPMQESQQLADASIRAPGLLQEAGAYSVAPAGGALPPQGSPNREFMEMMKEIGQVSRDYAHYSDQTMAANAAIIARVENNAIYGVGFNQKTEAYEPGIQGGGPLEQYAYEMGLMGPPSDAMRAMGLLRSSQDIEDPSRSAAESQLVGMLVEDRLSQWGVEAAVSAYIKAAELQEPGIEADSNSILREQYGISYEQYTAMRQRAEYEVIVEGGGLAQQAREFRDRSVLGAGDDREGQPGAAGGPPPSASDDLSQAFQNRVAQERRQQEETEARDAQRQAEQAANRTRHAGEHERWYSETGSEALQAEIERAKTTNNISYTRTFEEQPGAEQLRSWDIDRLRAAKDEQAELSRSEQRRMDRSAGKWGERADEVWAMHQEEKARRVRKELERSPYPGDGLPPA